MTAQRQEGQLVSSGCFFISLLLQPVTRFVSFQHVGGGSVAYGAMSSFLDIKIHVAK